jgi:hypothetical protein
MESRYIPDGKGGVSKMLFEVIMMFATMIAGAIVAWALGFGFFGIIAGMYLMPQGLLIIYAVLAIQLDKVKSYLNKSS